MDKKHFVLHLLPSRPDFAKTMSEEELAIMQDHIAYWMDLMNKGKVLAFGPVLDPKEVYGLGIVEVDSEEEVQEFIANDPAGKINKYEYHLMNAVVPKTHAN
ncbi:YciI family protein [Flavobacterium aquiphilum]|uniref:YciI family protein n=1 Tax=Flavobacterium aquiphilum TaxID=3003261 RepID=UPI00247FB833|nr:YciI family protein [Flavobacterium aquiphilum]